MKYKIIEDTTELKLETSVNSLLESGWKLQGGLFVSLENRQRYFYQAMIKEDE